jgi:hypothetical protein
MALSYSSFKTFLITFLWRDGDTVLIANLDSLIAMANAELNRIFKVEDRAVTVPLIATSTILPLPADFREMRNLSKDGVGPMTNLSPLQFAREDAANGSRQTLMVFTLANGGIKLSGGYSVEAPGDFTLTYYANIPDFKTTDESWMADLYLDVYAYCALKHAAPFLREDDRLMVWDGLYKAALQSALDENAQRKYAGAPQQITYGGGNG